MTPEERERHLRDAKIMNIEPVLAGTGYWGRAEAKFANLVGAEKDTERARKMTRRRKQLAAELQGLSCEQREKALLQEIEKWKAGGGDSISGHRAE